MLISTETNIKTITILVKDKEISVIKSILKYFKDKYKGFSVTKYRTGNIGEDTIISFKVHVGFYSKILEKFAYNDIPIIMNNKKEIKFVDNKKEEKRRKLRSQGWSDLSVDRKQVSFQELEELSVQGKIRKVAKEAKGGVGSKIEIINKAKELLSNTILNAIEHLIGYSEGSNRKKEEAIHELLQIASDKDLKTFQKKKEMFKAGEAAINIALSDETLFQNLITIANYSKLDHLINLKAAIGLAGIVLCVEENDKIDFSNVIKSLNTRWLKIAYETVQQKLSNEEQTSFNDLISFVESKRTETNIDTLEVTNL